MAYNYLEITNALLRSLNEVELTSANFLTAKAFYAHAKDAVNNALRDINQAGQDWPFNHVEQEDTLTAGESRYSFPTDASKIDFDSFRIKEDSTFGNDTVRLKVITYDDYLKHYVDQEYTADTSIRNVPTMVCHAPSEVYVVIPSPREAYELVYEYYRIPVDLVNPTDVPFVPERYKHVILDGAKYHAYMFRSNEQAANIAKGKFEEGLKRMRTVLINKYEYVTSTYIPQGTMLVSGSRIV
jgi:hypothetical protein